MTCVNLWNRNLAQVSDDWTYLIMLATGIDDLQS